MKKNMLFLSWRDIKHPSKGGAEVYTHEMLKRVDHSKFHITHISPKSIQRDGTKNAESEWFEGIHYLRMGNMLTVIPLSMLYYMKHHKSIDLVVDQCNTHRFFTPLWVRRPKRILFIHQLTREIWRMNLPSPLGIIGELMEDMMLRIYRRNGTITVSESTKKDLLNLGFEGDQVVILPEGIDFTPWEIPVIKKEAQLRFTYVGRFSSYKGIDDALEAFCLLYQRYPITHMDIVGKLNVPYKQEILDPIMKKYHVPEVAVTYHGFVSEEEKLYLMHRSHAMLFPSKREGWGLTVTEAAAVGTPSIVYNSPGLIDAVDRGRCGYMAEINDKHELARLMEASIIDNVGYHEIRSAAYEFAGNFNWENTAKAFEQTFGKEDDYEGIDHSYNHL